MNTKQQQEQRSARLREAEEIQRKAANLRMLIDSNRWPRWPVLPMKRWDKERHDWDFGIAFADSRPVVYRCAVFALDGRVGPTWGDVFARLSREEYEDAEAMVLAGWEVD